MNARKKLRAKNCDAIVANDVSGTKTGMESDENEVVIFFRDGEIQKISRASKKKIARELVKIISKMWEKSLTKKSWWLLTTVSEVKKILHQPTANADRKGGLVDMAAKKKAKKPAKKKAAAKKKKH